MSKYDLSGRGVSRVIGLAALLAAGGSPALGQERGRPPVYSVKGDPVVCTEYSDGQQRIYDARTDWHYMCGSNTKGLAATDLKAIAIDHAARVDPANPNILVIDTPRGLGDRGPGAVNVIFNINTTNMPASAPTSFTLAEQYIESKWANPITITISVSWANLGGGVIGATGSNYVTGVTWANSRAGLVAGMDANDTIQNFLPTGSTIPVRFNATAATITNVSTIDWTRANYRATVGAVGGSDCNMQFNSTFSFDFDPSNGVPANTLSLVDVIIHEVGHCQGFVSNADASAPTNINPLDIFRFARGTRAGVTNVNPSTTAELQTFAREVDLNNPTNDDANTDLISVAYRMSDGNPNQASHWFQQSFVPASAIGIMQPVLDFTETFYPNYYKQADLDAFDAIGWSYAPCSSAPTIGTQPAAQTVCAGAAINLSVVATGGSISYQWRKGGINVGGATASTFSIAASATTDAGSYDCVLTNSCGTATSNAAVVTVNSAATVTSPPASIFRCPGQSAPFSVTATGTPAPTYQWRKNGFNIAGATLSTYTIPAVSGADAATYSCALTNSCGTIFSAGALLTVSDAPVITSQPQPVTGCPGVGASFTVSSLGTTSHQWRKNTVDIVGATSSTLTIASVGAGDAGSYDCVLTNSCGSMTTNAVTLTLGSQPSISSQPSPLARCVGTSATFTVSASGSPTISYQWRKGGVDIGGATSSSLSIASVAAGDVGSYDCVVTTPCGSLPSSLAALTVQNPIVITTNPVAQTVCERSFVGFSVAVTGTGPLTYQWRRNGVNVGGFGSTYSINPVGLGDAGNYDCVVTGPCGPVTSSAALLTVNPAPAVTSGPNPQSVCIGAPASFSITATGLAPLSYQWRKNGVDIAGATSNSYAIPATSAADVAEYTCLVTNSCSAALSEPANLTVGGAPNITGQPAASTVCVGASASFTVVASADGTITYQWRKGGVDISGANGSTLNIPVAAAGDAATYDCVVSTCSSATSNPAVLTVNEPAAITAQPSGVSSCSGASVTLTVTATGSAPLSYQWRKNAVDISGATAASYNLPSLAVGDAGSYDCVVSNGCGSDTSTAAVVDVLPGPVVTTQPSSVGVCDGAAANLSVAATGATSYLWRKGGVALTDGPTGTGSTIAGATTADLSIVNCTVDDAASYTCDLIASCGSVTSDAATVSISSPPSIDTQPAALTRCLSGSVTFTVSATGTSPLSYQWRRNGSDIPGQTSASITITPVVVASGGTYDCVVTNDCGSATSNPVALTVCIGDFNCSGVVSVQDIFDFLAAYFANDPRSDVNGSGVISVQDIFDFLAAYFAGCPF